MNVLAASITIDLETIRPVLRALVAEVVAEMERDRAALPDRLAFTEREAAALLGLHTHQLRDERRRRRIAASQIVGNRIRYTREDLAGYLAARRLDGATGPLPLGAQAGSRGT